MVHGEGSVNLCTYTCMYIHHRDFIMKNIPGLKAIGFPLLIQRQKNQELSMCLQIPFRAILFEILRRRTNLPPSPSTYFFQDSHVCFYVTPTPQGHIFLFPSEILFYMFYTLISRIPRYNQYWFVIDQSFICHSLYKYPTISNRLPILHIGSNA